MNTDRSRARIPLESSLLRQQYPKVSHTFIRREILALERQGIDIERYAFRGCLETLPDSVDLRNRKDTLHMREGPRGARRGFSQDRDRLTEAVGSHAEWLSLLDHVGTIVMI